ncbi:MAG: hypothetical protein KKA32_10000 [Actinobacteria bacterium]|nr:hypothetical protein [Actinomycetota bacterium]
MHEDPRGYPSRDSRPRSDSGRRRDAITDALFDVEMEFQVVISTLVVCEEEWERGPYQVLPIRDEIERYGVAA